MTVLKISDIATSTERAAMVVRRATSMGSPCLVSFTQKHTFWIVDVDSSVWRVDSRGVQHSMLTSTRVLSDSGLDARSLEDALDWIGIRDQVLLPLPMPPAEAMMSRESPRPEPPHWRDSEDLRLVRDAIAGGCEGWRISLREFIDQQLETHKVGCLAKHGPCSAELLIRAGRATIAAILDDLEQLDKAQGQAPVSST